MRISDWSSDVCSSDLLARVISLPAHSPFDGPMDHWQETYWYAPANMLLDAGLVMPDAQRGTGIDIIGLNLMKPETETTTHYFSGMAHRNLHDEQWITDFWMSAVFHAFEDDRLMTEGVQRNMGSENEHDAP